jgi:hypothetical protein
MMVYCSTAFPAALTRTQDFNYCELARSKLWRSVQTVLILPDNRLSSSSGVDNDQITAFDTYSANARYC